MLGQYYYHEIIRKTIIAFGTLFNDINIKHKKQNDSDFWVSMFGGFEGYVSNIRYYSYAIDFNEINSMIKAGPSVNNCIDTGEIPPYLDDNWWFGNEY